MTKIKICGLTTLGEIEYANELKPDYIGFVFAPSKRQVTSEQAAALKAALSPDIKAVGVFVNQDIDAIAELCVKNIIDLVQIHGDEDADYLKNLKELAQKPVIRAVRVQCKEDALKALDIPADHILFDAYHPQSYGGTGHVFGWDLIKGFPRPFFLAGGLDAENIESAARTSPYCLDVSSGAETNGKKDRQKMKTIIDAARSVE